MDGVEDSAELARAFLRSVIREWDEHTLVELMLIFASELAGEESLAARAPFSVLLEHRVGAVRVRIAGGAGTTPPDDPPPNALRGRGMAVLAALADSWGVEGSGDRREVWFELLA